MDQLTRWQQPANWVQHLTNCIWQLDIMILTPVRDHSQLMVVSSPVSGSRESLVGHCGGHKRGRGRRIINVSAAR
eukprot:5674155-Prymnesium_polylepis.1